MKHTDIKEVSCDIVLTIYICFNCKAKFYGEWRSETGLINDYPNYCPSCGYRIEEVYEQSRE